MEAYRGLFQFVKMRSSVVTNACKQLQQSYNPFDSYDDKHRHVTPLRAPTKVHTCAYVYVGLVRTIYVLCIYGIYGREVIKYTVIYGVYIYGSGRT